MSPPPANKVPVCFLFDNGSLRAASTLSLRETARKLAAELGVEVRPVSLLHSSAVAADALGGEPAKLLEPALGEYLADKPEAPVVVLPLFFGPSGALTDYLPGRLAFLRSKYLKAEIVQAGWLVRADSLDDRIARALADSARKTIADSGLKCPRLVLVDHGSPQQEVTDVRNALGRQVSSLLGTSVCEVAVASMEKRSGPQYAFNDPLLAARLRTPPFDSGDVVVLLQFLSPGRHAGPDGDIATICREAQADRPGLRTYLTDTIANDDRVVAVLADRYREAVTAV